MKTDQPHPPGAGTTYRWTALSSAVVRPWADLTNVLADVDGTEEFYEPADLAEELEESGLDPERDTFAVWDGSALVAYGQVRVSGNLDGDGYAVVRLGGGVHPGARGRGVGRALIEAQEHRGTELAGQRHPGAPVLLRADGGLDGASVRALLTHRGYDVVRWFSLMTRPLTHEEPVAPPEGIRIVSPTPDLEEPVRLAHNEAFADHWGTAELTPERWHDVWSARGARFRVSSVALDADGHPLAYVMCGQWVARELYVNMVGTVRAARGRGLARACLARTISEAVRTGDYDTIDLHVDSESPTGATRLYESVGFERAKLFATCQREAAGD